MFRRVRDAFCSRSEKQLKQKVKSDGIGGSLLRDVTAVTWDLLFRAPFFWYEFESGPFDGMNWMRAVPISCNYLVATTSTMTLVCGK